VSWTLAKPFLTEQLARSAQRWLAAYDLSCVCIAASEAAFHCGGRRRGRWAVRSTDPRGADRRKPGKRPVMLIEEFQSWGC